MMCRETHIWVYAGDGSAMPDGWPCACDEQLPWHDPASTIRLQQEEIDSLHAEITELRLRLGEPMTPYSGYWEHP